MAYDLYIGLLHKQLSYAMAHGLVPHSLYMGLCRYNIVGTLTVRNRIMLRSELRITPQRVYRGHPKEAQFGHKATQS